MGRKRRLNSLLGGEDLNINMNLGSPPQIKRRKNDSNCAVRLKTPQLIDDACDDEDEDIDLLPVPGDQQQAGSKAQAVSVHYNHNHNHNSHGQSANNGGEDSDEDEDQDDDLAYTSGQPVVAPPESSAHTCCNQGEDHDDGDDEDEDIDMVGENPQPGKAEVDKVDLLKSKAEQASKLQEEIKKYYDQCGNPHVAEYLTRLNKQRAKFLNEIDRLAQVDSGKRYCLKYCPKRISGKLVFVPDVGHFTRAEYTRHQDVIYEMEQKEKDKERQKLMQEQKQADARRLQETLQLLKMAEKKQQEIGRTGSHYHQGKWDAEGHVWEFKDQRQRNSYGTAITDVIEWFNEHQNKLYNDNKFGAVLWEKSGSGFAPVFARVTVEEYNRNQQRFAAAMKAHREDITCDVKHDGNPIYRRVIDMDI